MTRVAIGEEELMLTDLLSMPWMRGSDIDPALIELAIQRTKDRDPYRLLSWLIGMGLVSSSIGNFQAVQQYLAMHRQ